MQNGEHGDNRDNELIDYLTKHISSYDYSKLYHPVEQCILSTLFRNIVQKIKGFEVYEDDIWMPTFPRCGSTWTLEMVWLIVNNLDYKGAETDLYLRIPAIELGGLPPVFLQAIDAVNGNQIGDIIEFANKMPRPRIIRSHLPLSLLPTQLMEKKPKIVTVLRNPKDAAVSRYHLQCSLNGYSGTAEKMFEAFRKGLLPYGCFWYHTASFWKPRKQLNILHLTFEEMKKDLPAVIRRTAAFLGKEFTDEQVAELAEHLSFSKMKTNNSVNFKPMSDYMNTILKLPFVNAELIRKGNVGEHKEVMSEETIKEYDEWNNDMKQKLGLSDDEDFPL